MEDFNANEARRIVKSTYDGELHNILVDIKNAAIQGKNVLHIYNPLNSLTINSLREKGFNVIDHPSIAIQRDNLYYSIKWD